MADNSTQIQNLESQLAKAKSNLALDRAFLDDTNAQLAAVGAYLADPKTPADQMPALQQAQKDLAAKRIKDQSYIDGREDSIKTLTKAVSNAKVSAIDSKTTPAIQPVKSGSGDVAVKIVDIPASKYAQENYTVDNAGLLSTNTTVTQTRKAAISKATLNQADKDYTTAMNNLGTFTTAGDTSSGGYELAKINAMAAQRNWELARDGLEEVIVEDRAANSERVPSPFADDVDAPASAVDLDGSGLNLVVGENGELSNVPVEGGTDGPDIVVTGKKIDARIRLRPKERSGTTFPFFGKEDSVLYQLNETEGVFFPYTPTISMAHKANYSQMAPTHANTDYHIYTNTPAVQIQIQGQFSAQNLAEAKYTLAAMHFFRSAVKMHFGDEEATAGTAGLPPPPLVLSGYGQFMFNELTVLLTDFSMDLPANVDYIEVTIGGMVAWVPSLTTFNLTCVVQQTPKQQREDFNLGSFASGQLLKDKKGWI